MDLVLQEDDFASRKNWWFYNFANATDEEVKGEIVTLFQSQKQLAAFICQHFMLDPDIRIYQMFIIAVANSDFAKYLYSSIEKKLSN